jgi:2-iminobutanoate/2-iminopropanoate deaminase
MVKEILDAPNLPFSKAILHNQQYTMELSGQIGLDENGKLVDGIEEQTRNTLENIKGILQEVGWTFDNLIKVRIYLTNMEAYALVNKIYAEAFENTYPARVVVAVKELPLNALIEIDCTAAGNQPKLSMP